MKLLGIDPGITGGLAILESEPRLNVVDAVEVPTVLDGPKRRVNARWVLDWLFQHRPTEGFVERAQAMPVKGRHGKEGEEQWQGQGASSAFIYGRATGYLEALSLAAGVRLHIVEASVWKRQAGLIVKGVKRTPTEVKEASRLLAIELFPAASFLLHQKSSHGRGEAILIGRHGWLNVLKGRTDEVTRTTAAPEDATSAEPEEDDAEDADLQDRADQASAEQRREGAA